MSIKNTSLRNECPVCSERDIEIFVEIPQVPLFCNVLWPDMQEAINAPKGDICLGFCRNCTHISNFAFNPELMEYTQDYENALHFSSMFQSYAKSLANELIEGLDLRGKNIVEIGCGDGDFLRHLCKLGNNRGVGFDPGYDPQKISDGLSSDKITFIKDFYTNEYTHIATDFICCRHVLEHTPSPQDFINGIRHTIGNRMHISLYLEVPNVSFNLQEQGFWDLIYEHCSYFSKNSLFYLLQSCRFKVLELKERFEGQFLSVKALPDNYQEESRYYSPDNYDDLVQNVVTFPERYRYKFESWKQYFEKVEKTGSKVVVWGVGSKGVSFLNILETQSQIEYVVDINPRKHGMYVAGTGQKIVPPGFLQKYKPDTIIIMNHIYQGEIGKLIKELGLKSDLMVA